MMPKEYIDREALEKRLNERLECLRKEYGYYDHYTDGYDEAVDAVEETPAADVVEVVRCEKCKHWKNHRTGLLNIKVGECHNDDFPFHCESQPITRATDFCSYGERKEV